MVVEKVMAKDISTRVDATVNGKTVHHRGREYSVDPYTGKLVLVADYSPTAAVSALLHPNCQPSLKYKLELGRTIDMLLCMYEMRSDSEPELDDYYRTLRAWYSFGRERGVNAPSLPDSPLVRCSRIAPSLRLLSQSSADDQFTIGTDSSETRISFDGAERRGRLCQLRKERLISFEEYWMVRQMIADYEGGHLDSRTERAGQPRFIDLPGYTFPPRSYRAADSDVMPPTHPRLEEPAVSDPLTPPRLHKGLDFKPVDRYYYVNLLQIIRTPPAILLRLPFSQHYYY